MRCNAGSEEEDEVIGRLLCLLFVYFLDAFNCQSSIQGTMEVYSRVKSKWHRSPVISHLFLDCQTRELYTRSIYTLYTMPPKAESSTAYREPTVQDDDDDDFDDLDGKRVSCVYAKSKR